MIEPWDHWSASQVETFGLCERKWYFKSVMRLKTEESASAALGKAVHASIESYLNGEIAATQLHDLARRVYERGLIPKPGSVKVEHAIPKGAISAAGVPCEGFIDVLDFGTLHAEPAVTDWKTRGDPARYSKTDEQLSADVQLHVYAAEALRLTDPLVVHGATVRHVNIGTKAPNAVTVSGPVRLTRESVARFFAERIEPAVSRMKETALAPSPFRVTPNFRACGAFGGCPFKDKCNADQRVAGISTPTTPGATTMSTKDQIMSRLRNGGTAETTPATVANPVRPPDAPPSGAKAALLARLAGNKGADAPKPEPAPEVAPKAAPALVAGSTAAGADRKPRGHAEKLATLGYDEKQIARMKASAMHEAIDGKIAASGVSVTKDGDLVAIPKTSATPIDPNAGPDLEDLDSCVKFASDVLGFADDEIDAMPDEMLVFVAEKKIKRASVDLVMGTDGKIADLEEKPAPAPVRAAAERAPEPGPIVPVTDGLVLYVGCRPVKGAHARAAVALEDYLRPFAELVAKDAKVEHYGLIEYNEGPKRVAALVLRDPPKGVFVVSPGYPCSSFVLEALRPFADAVIVAGA